MHSRRRFANVLGVTYMQTPASSRVPAGPVTFFSTLTPTLLDARTASLAQGESSLRTTVVRFGGGVSVTGVYFV
jgi:hypothetical protein